MARILCIFLFLSKAFNAAAQQDLEITGLVLDQAISGMGHEFFEYFTENWTLPGGSYIIEVRERPDPLLGSTITVFVNDIPVFQNIISMRSTQIEEKALLARDTVSSYLFKNTIFGAEDSSALDF